MQKKNRILKLSCLLLSCLLFFGALPVSAGQPPLPESDHPYANGVTDVKTYADPAAARGLFVTFSEDTWVEPYESRWILIPGPTDITVGDVLSHWVRSGDYIALMDADRRTVGTFSGDALAGKTVYVPTASFEILLNADGDTNGYGYKVTGVRPATADEVRRITYHDAYTGLSQSFLAPRGEGGYFLEECELQDTECLRDGFAFSGWATVPGGGVVFDPEGEIPAGMGDMELWAVWTPLSLRSDEVLSFSNSSWYFEGGDRENYYLSAEDYRAMQLNLYKTYGLGPVPGPVLSAVLATYPDWDWRGSCYGMSTVVALQHYGYIDLLGPQNASSVSDLQADDALISRINYYQSQAATSWLTENKAYVIGSDSYRAQLRRIFASVQAGNTVMFTYYPDKAFLDTGHTVLFTGAYTRADGSHVLIAYNCNDAWSYLDSYYDDHFVITPDFSAITDDWDDEIGAFNWTDKYDQFASFDASVKGNPLTWYKALLRHLLDLMNTLKTMISNLQGR